MLTDPQVERYSRQIILPPVGGRGQAALLRAAVAVAGDHAAVDIALVYLAAAGVGRLSRLAPDAPGDVVNPDVAIERWPMPGTVAALAALASAHALVVGVGAVDEIRQMHEACSAAARPLVWGFSEGPRAWIARCGHSREPACAACLTTLIGDTSAGSRVTSMAPVAAAWTGTLLASEALKHLLGMPDALAGRYLTYDATAGTVASVPVRPVGACPTCTGPAGPRPSHQP